MFASQVTSMNIYIFAATAQLSFLLRINWFPGVRGLSVAVLDYILDGRFSHVCTSFSVILRSRLQKYDFKDKGDKFTTNKAAVDCWWVSHEIDKMRLITGINEAKLRFAYIRWCYCSYYLPKWLLWDEACDVAERCIKLASIYYIICANYSFPQPSVKLKSFYITVEIRQLNRAQESAHTPIFPRTRH